MAHVRGHRVDQPLVSIQPQCVVAAAIIDPEVAIEAFEEVVGLRSQTDGQLVVAPHLVGQLGRASFGVVHVPLDLAQRDGRLGEPPVGELDARPRVLPALVDQPLRRPGGVLHVAVSVAVAVLVDPLQGPESRPAEPPGQLVVTGDPPVLR